MSVVSILQEFPQDLQLHVFKLVEAVRDDFREEFAVRRQDFDELLRETV